MKTRYDIQLFRCFLAIILSFSTVMALFANQGDTILVQTVTFDDTLQLGALTYVYPPPRGEFHKTQDNYYQGGTYLFPPDTIKFEKILMNFTLKCDPKNNPACGEWDFIGFIYAYKDSIRYELGRFETPFGFGLNLGDGFTWTYDVSDFRTILYDSVTIKYIVPQQGQTRYELLDLKFIMIEGIPPRDVIKIENLWYGGFRYGDSLDPVESHLEPMTINLLPNVKTTKIRATIGGDGWGGSTGCAEFCAKEHWFNVDGTKRFSWVVWKDDCDMNPLYPQGGTWLNSRSNRCPGSQIDAVMFELTPYASESQITLDYDIEPYIYPEDGEFWPLYTIETQLVSYGVPNFTLDAAVEDIISPNNWEFYNRYNPICGKPIIIIKNTGSNDLKSLVIDYGVAGGVKTQYRWQGNLAFMQKDTVQLPQFDMGVLKDEGNIFEVEVSTPNGLQDEYSNNNKSFRIFSKPPEFFNDMILKLKTNNYVREQQYNYTLKDAYGNILYSRSNMADNTTYLDTFKLEDGCYEFRFRNELGYGLDYWALRKDLGSGWIKFSNFIRDIKVFNPDFGKEIYQQFTVGPKPMLTSTADTLNFGVVNINEQKDLTFDIMPANNQSLIITKININFGSTKGFTLTTEPPIATSPVTLATGQKMTITVTYMPKKAGKSVVNLIISSNDALVGDKTIKLIGTGLDPNEVEASYYEPLSLKLAVGSNPIIDITEITFSFGEESTSVINSRLSIFNSLGQEVQVLYEGKSGPFQNIINFIPDKLVTGVYYLTLKAANEIESIPIVIIGH